MDLSPVMEVTPKIKGLLINSASFFQFFKFMTSKDSETDFNNLFYALSTNSKKILIQFSKEFFYNDIFGLILMNPNIKENKSKYL